MVEARILIADDSKMNQQILSEILGDRYEYLYADDGMQALDLLHSEFDIDLLLLDINNAPPRRLRRARGDEAAQLAAGDPRHHHLVRG